MKRICKTGCLLLVLLLLAGCALKPAQAQEEDPAPPQSEPESPQEPSDQTGTPVQDAPSEDMPTDNGEPEGWEEDWPEEYVVDGYRFEDGALAQTGELNKYRYLQLDGAQRYIDIISLYVQQFLGVPLSTEEDSAHDGYANVFLQCPGGNASVSGSSITGRFSYNLSPNFDQIAEKAESPLMDEAAMERSAREFTALFSSITGELELLKSEQQEADYHDPDSDCLRDVSVPVMVFTFRSAENSALLDIQDGLPAPVCCGDSMIDNLNVHCFVVTVWPDGTVVEANNYITRADVVATGTIRMPDEDDFPKLLNFFTSYTEHDTVVFDSICADHFDVYFGSADIEPAMTVEYHLESDPENSLSTQFVLPGLFDPV